MDLHDRYLSFHNASEDKIPIVRQVIELGDCRHLVRDHWVDTAPAVLGERLNPVPVPAHEPAQQNATSNGSGRHDPAILEKLRARKAEAQAARLQEV